MPDESQQGQPAPDANVDPSTVADSSPAAANTGESQRRPDDGFTRRIDELTRDWRTEQRAHESTRSELDRARRELEQLRQPPKQQEVGSKTLADFEFDDQRYGAYLREEATRAAREAAQAEFASQREREMSQRRTAQFAEKQKAFAKDTQDYHSVVSNPAFTQSEALVAEIMESDEGPAIAYYLGNNLDIAARLNALPPVAVAREVARIEARLVGEREKAKAAKNQIPAGNPPPPKLEGGGDPGTTVRVDSAESDSLSDAEWARRRTAQLRARSNRK